MSVKRSTDPGEGGSLAHSKRVRFGRDNDDSPHSFEEVDDSDLLEKRKQRRGAVKLQGYREDDNSSDEDDNGDKSRKGKAKKKDDNDDDDDMFGDSQPKRDKKAASDDEEDDEANQHEYAEFVEKDKIARWKDSKGRGGPGSGSRFDQSEIEGEATIEEADQEYDSEGNPTIEAFNMRAEIDEEGGQIDREGNFIRAKEDPDRFHDNWLQGISRKDIAAAKEAEERKRQRQRILDREEEAASRALSKDDIYLELVNLLKPSETVLEAIQRLGGSGGKTVKGAQATKKKSWQKSKQQQQPGAEKNSTDTSPEDAAAAAENKRRIEKVTDLSDKMMAMGHFDIYDQTYERIVRELRRADLIADDWVIGTPVPKPGDATSMLLDDLDDPLFGSAATPVQWEYKWASSNAGEAQEPQQGETEESK
ncbi:hypothetical protein BGZ73_003946 [Actinomortierella ambigua]|nr:hypothetical protein BGZ73_003946 [Actinomortierella ambigua]